MQQPRLPGTTSLRFALHGWQRWYPRYKLGGTYDQNWSDNIAPFLPEDFDEHYYQCAPEDQQCEHLRGGEEIVLLGLTPNERLEFTLPQVSVPMQAILKNGDRHNLDPRIDTLTIEPDERRFTLVWRAHITIRKSIHEMDTLIVGKPTRGWEHARIVNKPYVPMKNLNSIAKLFHRRNDGQMEKYKNSRELK